MGEKVQERAGNIDDDDERRGKSSTINMLKLEADLSVYPGQPRN
jgi:hypothetical protein